MLCLYTVLGSIGATQKGTGKEISETPKRREQEKKKEGGRETKNTHKNNTNMRNAAASSLIACHTRSRRRAVAGLHLLFRRPTHHKVTSAATLCDNTSFSCSSQQRFCTNNVNRGTGGGGGGGGGGKEERTTADGDTCSILDRDGLDTKAPEDTKNTEGFIEGLRRWRGLTSTFSAQDTSRSNSECPSSDLQKAANAENMTAARRIQRMIELEWALAPWAVDPKTLQQPNYLTDDGQPRDRVPAVHAAARSGEEGNANKNRGLQLDEEEKARIMARQVIEGVTPILGSYSCGFAHSQTTFVGRERAGGVDEGSAKAEAEAEVIASICPYRLSYPPTPRAPLQSLLNPKLSVLFAEACGMDAAVMRTAAAVIDQGAFSSSPPLSASSPEKTVAVPFPFTPLSFLQYSAGDKRLKADSVNVVEQSLGEIQCQLDTLFETLTRRDVIPNSAAPHLASPAKEYKKDGDEAAKEAVFSSNSNSSSDRDVNVTYFIVFVTNTMGGATVQRLIDDVCLGVHLRQLGLIGEMADNSREFPEKGHVCVPIVVGNAIPSTTDIGNGAPLTSFPYCRSYTLLSVLQELLLLPKSCSMSLPQQVHPHDGSPAANARTFKVNNQIIVLSNCLNVVESAVLQAQHAPRQLLRAGASKDSKGRTSKVLTDSTLSNIYGVPLGCPRDGPISRDSAHLARPPSPEPLLEMPPVAVAPFLFHTGHGAGGSGWLPSDRYPNFNPFLAPVDSARIDAGLMPWEIDALTEYMQHFIMTDL